MAQMLSTQAQPVNGPSVRATQNDAERSVLAWRISVPGVRSHASNAEPSWSVHEWEIR
jgi:hypothetical protein